MTNGQWYTRWWSMALVGATGALLGITTMVVLGRPHPQTGQAQTPVAAGRPVVAPSSGPSVAVESTVLPTWVGRKHATWARDGSKTISFELQASNDVPVWMTRARPVLVVRCLFRSTDVFIATGTAASIEPQAGSHTVRLQIDHDQELVQQWSDSESSQELFAPDGAALVRRLAQAQYVRFGFTPYNTKPVTVEFIVQGFDKLAGLVASTCGWRLDDSGTPRTRPVRSK